MLTDSTCSSSAGRFTVTYSLKLAESGRLPEEPLDQGPEVTVEHGHERLDEVHLCATMRYRQESENKFETILNFGAIFFFRFQEDFKTIFIKQYKSMVRLKLRSNEHFTQ